MLENNAGNPVTVNANGTFTFTTAIASGSAYNVGVRTQPTATPAQTCTVSSGTGTVGSAAVTNVAVQCRAQAGRFVYVAVAGVPNAVAGFTIDANTGALTPMVGSPFPAAGQAPRVLFSAHPGFLYVYGDDNITGPGATTLTGFSMNAQTGALTPIPGPVVDLPAAAGPPAFHPNGNFIYVPVSDGFVSTNNRLHAFSADAMTGALTTLPDFPLALIGPGEVLNSAVLSPNGASLYLATSIPASPPVPATGKISRLAVDAQTGAVTVGGSQATDSNNSFNGIFMHPSGTHFYTRNSTSVAFTSRFTLDVATGAIGARADIPTAFGFGLVIAPAGRVYFAELGGSLQAPLAGSVAGYVDAASGPMTALPGSPFPTGGTNSLAQALDPTGRFLAITNLGSANVTVMRVDSAQGSLAQVAGSPYAPAVGQAPGSVTYDPSARFAYLTDGAGSISSYAINVDTGVPTYVNSQLLSGSPGVVPVTILGRQ